MEALLHIALPLLAFVGAVYMERYKARVLSRITFWDRHAELEGTFVSIWEVNPTPGSPAPAPVEDFLEVEWAAGGYISGHGVNSRYGKYVVYGSYTGQALALTYRGAQRELKKHIGVVYLQMHDANTLGGTWAQSRPDLGTTEGGKVTWRRRYHDKHAANET